MNASRPTVLALKGRDPSAQGNALGTGHGNAGAPKGREMPCGYRPFRARTLFCIPTQGVALC